jgi:hypothetical protein
MSLGVVVVRYRLRYAAGMGTEGAWPHGTIEKAQTVAMKSKSCIPRRINNAIVTIYQLFDNKMKLLMKYITVFF